MSQYREIISLLPHCLYPSNADPRSELNSAACSNLNAVGSQRCVITYSRQRRDIDQGPSNSSVQRQAQNDASRRTEHLRFNHNEAMLRVE